MTDRTSYIDRQMTSVLKGIAIIMMFALHFVAHPDWYISFSYKGIETISKVLINPLDLCVSIFAFLTGYFYFFTQKRTIKIL